MPPEYDAVVIGAGPNGLTAAIELARHGCKVMVLEAAASPGGGVRSDALTLPGFRHDVCSAVYPLTVASPYLRTLPLAQYGLHWIRPSVAVAHPHDDGSAACLHVALENSDLGSAYDNEAYRTLISPFVQESERLFDALLRPLTDVHHPILMARFGRLAIQSAFSLAERSFRSQSARALFAGLAAHSVLPLTAALSAGVGLILAIAAHGAGWPIPRGGAGALTAALVAHLKALGGQIECFRPVVKAADIPSARAVLFDTGPHQLGRIAADRLPASYRAKLASFRYGPGVFKIDWALDGPIPFRNPVCAEAATVHIGGTLAEVTNSEQAAWDRTDTARPFVLLSQPSVFDPTRAPAGKHTAWAYCHVPSASTTDMTAAIETQVERVAPGFTSLILARHTRTAAGMERYNANYVGGDISGGVLDWRQLIARPVLRRSPYATPAEGIYLCSASTPPGGGVHGMCGFHAARAAIRNHF